jgi:hypothetical protein
MQNSHITPFIARAFKDFGFDQENITDPEIVTRADAIEKLKQNPNTDLSKVEAFSIPDISVIFRVGGSEGADVMIDLLDTGNEDEGVIQYDADIHIGNDDSTGPLFMLCALAACLERFYALGLDKKFGNVTGNW